MELISIKNEKDSHSFQGLTIQQIEIFLTAARHLNYSQAAKDLYLSQPAVSSRIKSMEDTVGFRLFIRKNRGVELTAEGSELYTRLEHAYQRFRVAVNMIVRDMSPAPKLNIGCLNSDEIVRLTDTAVRSFKQARPAADIDYEMYNYNELYNKLGSAEKD